MVTTDQFPRGCEKRRYSSLWLAVGAVLLGLSMYNRAIPVAAWLFPVFLIRFFRSRPVGAGSIVGGAVLLCVALIKMWQVCDFEQIPPLFCVGAGLVLGLSFFLPFLIDRLLVAGREDISSTFIFPLAWVSLEYLKTLANGSWGALAYSQYGCFPLMQLASVTGLWGISFLIAWFGSLVNFVWTHKITSPATQRLLWIYGGVLLCVLLFGGTRLAFSPEASSFVRIAAVNNPAPFAARFYKIDWADQDKARRKSQRAFSYFMRQSELAAQAGALGVLAGIRGNPFQG